MIIIHTNTIMLYYIIGCSEIQPTFLQDSLHPCHTDSESDRKIRSIIPVIVFTYLLTTEIVNHLVTTAKGKIAFLRIVTITRIYQLTIFDYVIIIILYYIVQYTAAHNTIMMYVPAMRKNLYNTNDICRLRFCQIMIQEKQTAWWRVRYRTESTQCGRK